MGITAYSNQANNPRLSLAALGWLVVLIAFLLASASTSVSAQTNVPVAPIVDNGDANNVDVLTGFFNFRQDELTIGTADGGGLSFSANNRGAGWAPSVRGSVRFGTGGVSRVVSIGDFTENFLYSGGVYTSQQGSGATLTYSNFKYTYTAADGTKAVFISPGSAQYYVGNPRGIIDTLTRPNGAQIKFHYVYAQVCRGGTGGGGLPDFSSLEPTELASADAGVALTIALQGGSSCNIPIDYYVRLRSISSGLFWT